MKVSHHLINMNMLQWHCQDLSNIFLQLETLEMYVCAHLLEYQHPTVSATLLMILCRPMAQSITYTNIFYFFLLNCSLSRVSVFCERAPIENHKKTKSPQKTPKILCKDNQKCRKYKLNYQKCYKIGYNVFKMKGKT